MLADESAIMRVHREPAVVHSFLESLLFAGPYQSDGLTFVYDQVQHAVLEIWER